MSVLWVHTGFENAFSRSIRSYEDLMTDIRDNYQAAQNRLEKASSDSLIYSCNTYVKRRTAAINEKISAARSVEIRVKAYVEQVIQVDNQIGSLIHKQSYNFYQKTGIGPQKDTFLARNWYGLCATVEDFWHDASGTAARLVDEIKGALEANKYLVQIVKDVAELVSAVFVFSLASFTGPLGLICFIGAVYAVTRAMYKTSVDIKALEAHKRGDEAEAEQWAEKKLSTAIVDAGEWLDSTFNLNIGIFEVAAKGTAIFLETASFVCGVVTIINQVKTCFNLQDLRSLDLRNPTSRSFRQSLVYAKNIKWFRADRLGSFENWLNFTQKGFIASFETKGLSLGTEIAEILLS